MVSCALGTHPARTRTLKQELLARASVSLYAKSEDIDPVSGYGASVMYQCRGDLTLPDCASCVKTAFGTNLNTSCLVSSFRQVDKSPFILHLFFSCIILSQVFLATHLPIIPIFIALFLNCIRLARTNMAQIWIQYFYEFIR